MDPRVERILSRVPGLDAARARVSPLEGGITNRNYRVESGGRTLVLRIGGENSALLGIDRAREHAASSIAARLGIGAEVEAFFPEENALLTRFVEGRVLDPSSAREPGALARIARAVRRLHQGPTFPGAFSPFDTVRSYGALARERGVAFPAEVPRAIEVLGSIERALGVPPRLAPCHNDLLAANFIDDGRSVRILDWEYAAQGDPFFDLGNFAANQELSDGECKEVLRHYRGEVLREELARLHLQRLASDMRETFWGFLQKGISTIDFDYDRYARMHLERYLRGVESASLSRWMEETCAKKPGS